MADRVKDFVAKNMDCRVAVVSMEFNISLAKVKKYLKLDYVEIKGNNHNFLLCEKCSRPINSGTYCGVCSSDMANKKAVLMKVHRHHRS